MAALGVRERSSLAGAIIRTLDDRNPTDPDRPFAAIDETPFQKEIGAIGKLLDTMQPTPAYYKSLAETFNATAAKIESDNELLTTFANWSSATPEQKQDSLIKVLGFYFGSFTDVTGIGLQPLEVTLFSREKSAGGYVEPCTFDALMNPEGMNGKLRINQHIDAVADDPAEWIAKAIHEATHKIDLDMAWQWNFASRAALGTLGEDAEMMYEISANGATTTSKYPTPYWHHDRMEKTARMQQERFGSYIRTLTGNRPAVKPA